MEINEKQATCLCNMVVDDLKKWPSLMAALQSGKGEINKIGIVEQAMSSWLHDCAELDNLLVLMEHKHIDYAFIDKNTVGKSKLSAKGVIEFKFNYATQDTEIKDRLDGVGKPKKKPVYWSSSAMQQAASYARNHGLQDPKGCTPITHAYVLFLIANIPILPDDVKSAKNSSVDSGWQYLSKKDRTVEKASDQISQFIRELDVPKELDRPEIIGKCSSPEEDNKDPSFGLYCCLIKVPVGFKDPGNKRNLPASSKRSSRDGDVKAA